VEVRNATRNNGGQCLLCRLREKRVVWEELSEVRKCHPIKMWCVVGDFKSIKFVV